MNTEIIKNEFTKIAVSNVSNAYVFDIMNDNVDIYEINSNSFVKRESKVLSEYLNDIKSVIKEEFISSYMNCISIPKLQEEKNSGNETLCNTYTTLNNKTFTNICKLVEIDGNNYILVIEISLNNNVSKKDEKYNSLVNSLSDSIVKIENIFNLDSENNNIKNIEEYVSSLFSSLYSSFPEIKKTVTKTTVNVIGRSLDSIMIVDDDKLMRSMIKKVFDDDSYKLVELENGREAIDYLESNYNKGLNSASDHVVGIFLDLKMPVLDGFSVLNYLSEKGYLNKVPVIIISGDYEKETKVKVYNYNIADMLEKPFDIQVVRHRISNFINLYKSSNSLNNLVSMQNNSSKELINQFVESYKYDYKNDIDNIKSYIIKLCMKLIEEYPEYNLTGDKIEKIADASMYYDVGYYSIPRGILSKKEGFNESELNIIKNYPVFGYKMLETILSLINDDEYKEYAYNITKYYHENYDGTGYPSGLSKDNIPFEAQVAAICIAYNNMRKKGVDAIKYIQSKAGIMFNSKLVDAFIKIND